MHVAAMNDTLINRWTNGKSARLVNCNACWAHSGGTVCISGTSFCSNRWAALVIAAATGVTLSYLWPVDGPATRGHLIAGVYCDEVSREMPDLIARRLKPQRAEQLCRHVANCPDCQRSLQQMGVKMPLSLDGHHHHRDGECPYCHRASTLATIESSRSLAAFLNR